MSMSGPLRYFMLGCCAIIAGASFAVVVWQAPAYVRELASAASFDADLRASTTKTYAIGTAAAEWRSISNTLFFSTSSNLGISSSSFTPVSRVQVRGGNVYLDTYGCGVMLTDSNGVCWRVFAVDSSGSAFQTATTSCTSSCVASSGGGGGEGGGGGGSSIALIGSATGTTFSSATASPTANLPSGFASGDLLLAFVVTNANATSSSMSGWTQVRTRQNAGNDASTFLMYRVADGTEGSSWTFTNLFTATQQGVVVVSAWDNVSTSTPVNASSSNNQAAATSVSGPSITPSVDGAMFVQFLGTDPSTFAYSGSPDSSPVGSEIYDAKDGGSLAYAAVQYYLQTSQAALALDYTALTSDNYAYFQVALTPQ
jgi:hypothetical protein